MQHREPSDAGIEERDGQISGVASGTGGNGGTADGRRPSAAVPRTQPPCTGAPAREVTAAWPSRHAPRPGTVRRASGRSPPRTPHTHGTAPCIACTGLVHAARRPGRRGGPRSRAARAPSSTCALILLVALVMAGVVAAMKGVSAPTRAQRARRRDPAEDQAGRAPGAVLGRAQPPSGPCASWARMCGIGALLDPAGTLPPEKGSGGCSRRSATAGPTAGRSSSAR